MVINKFYFSTDKGFAPLSIGHEPIMLLLHQSALSTKKSTIASVGFEPTHVMMKTLCLNHLTIRPKYL